MKVLYSDNKDGLKDADKVLSAMDYTAGHFERSAD